MCEIFCHLNPVDDAQGGWTLLAGGVYPWDVLGSCILSTLLSRRESLAAEYAHSTREAFLGPVSNHWDIRLHLQ